MKKASSFAIISLVTPFRGWGREFEGGCRGLCSLAPSLKITFLLLAAVCLLAACGKKLEPLSPDAVLPGPVREFRLTQEGESLVLSWLIPQENLLGQPLTQVQGFRLYRAELPGPAPQPGCIPDFRLLADIDLAYPRAGRVQGEAVLYQDAGLTPDRRYEYRVAAYVHDRYLGAWSPTLSHAWGALPRAVRGLQAEAGDRAATLTWEPVSRRADGAPLTDLAGYHLYRRSDRQSWRRITPQPLAATAYHDVALTNEVAYNYRIRAVRRLGGDLLESLDAPDVTVTPVDLTPPPPLLNLVAAPTPRGVELRWDESPATDLAGYRVYRRVPGEAQYRRLTPTLLNKPYFLDDAAPRGRTYYYVVTAVDDSKRANESLPSEEAEVAYEIR
ncbi:MAG: fibronectin type III domain-containing protein [Deltaproteobacteria bacterium]|nr:fibronectin type III domain-containing protein [Deltaproteobacteria bacterium]